MFSNKTNIPLPLAVWLASPNGYDFDPDPKTISATSLLKPIRSLVLGQRIVQSSVVDLDDLVASAVGTSVHTAAEAAWKTHFREALQQLGYGQSMIDRVQINPSVIEENNLNIFIEQRAYKKIKGFTITGKYDFVIDGQLHDIKTTKTYSWITGTNNVKYLQQGSIYRWLNPQIIFNNMMVINYLFTDWSPLKQLADPQGYPPNRILAQELPLLSLDETERFIADRLQIFIDHQDLDQSALPRCTPEELWQDRPTFAYYKDPSKTSRATKLFDLEQDAMIRCSQDGGKGLIVKREAEPKFCRFCSARPICSQAEEYEEQGILPRY